MIPTNHFTQRKTQRGQTDAMIALALQCGELSGDKCISNRKNIQKLIDSTDKRIKKLIAIKQKNMQLASVHLVNSELEALQERRRIALKVLDKGGITVVFEADRLITTYNTNSFKRC